MRGNEALLATAKSLAQTLATAGKRMSSRRIAQMIARRAWQRHRKINRTGLAKVNSLSWQDVSPAWKGRYLKIAREAIASIAL